MTHTSARGIEALEHEEGVVLHSYRDVVGRWTIGAGITSAAGVGKVGPNMVITMSQATAMLEKALAQSYEPAVATAMAAATQQEFDAGILFHWNTGAIRRASWVKLWRAHAGRAAISAKYRLWNKGGGKVLPALARRRERELMIMFDGVYPMANRVRKSVSIARWSLPVSAEEKSAAIAAFATLGYRVDGDGSAAQVRRFQQDHGLAPDGVIGRATLTTLQRRLDAKSRAATAALASAGATPVATSDVAQHVSGVPYAGLIVAGCICLGMAWVAWRYRDVIATKINRRAPRLAALLRSV